MAYESISKKTNKIISIVLVAVVVLNIILFSFRKISVKVFWIVIAIGAVYAYFIMPRVKGKG